MREGVRGQEGGGLTNVGITMQRCIEECLSCYSSCMETIPHCLGMGGEHSKPDHISLMFECARVCQLSAEMMLLNSPRHMDTCRLCSDVCEQCAESCASMNVDPEMAECEHECRRCAESCRQMAAQ